jgi:hypothetical protein
LLPRWFYERAERIDHEDDTTAVLNHALLQPRRCGNL